MMHSRRVSTYTLILWLYRPRVTAVISVKWFIPCSYCSPKDWTILLSVLHSPFWLYNLIGSCLGEREEEGARISLPAALLIMQPLSLCISSNTISVSFKFKQRDCCPFPITTLMECFSSEAVIRSSVKHGCFEASTS